MSSYVPHRAARSGATVTFNAQDGTVFIVRRETNGAHILQSVDGQVELLEVHDSWNRAVEIARDYAEARS